MNCTEYNKQFSTFLFFLLLATTFNPDYAVSGSSWHMVNVNTNGVLGDAHMLVNGDTLTMIDAGEYELAKASLLPYLRKIGIKSIDHFFVSHPHNDHYKGIDALLEGGITINNIYYNMPPDGVSDFAYSPDEFITTLRNAENHGANLHNIGKGFSISFTDSSEIKVLYAQKDRQLNGVNLTINDFSLIIRWDVDGFRVLFTGDLNNPLGSYLSKYEYFKADILKVPHHGVTGIAPDVFFDTVDPSLNMFPTPLVLWSNPRIEQAKKWTLNKQILYCVAGLNGNIVLNFNQSLLILLPEISTQSCPVGSVNIIPGQKINEPAGLPQMLLLLNNN